MLQTQAIEMLRTWQHSEEGMRACERYKAGYRDLVIEGKDGAKGFVIHPPKVLQSFFQNQSADDEEDAVVHSSDFSLGARYGLTDVSAA